MTRHQMIRSAAALVFALTLSTARLHAQDTALTVTVASAEVHKGPSTGTPVIGHVSRGTVMPISRNLGSWVKVAWPSAPDGIGYVHVTMGRISVASAEASPKDVTPRASVPSTRAPLATPPVTRTSVGEQVAPRRPMNAMPTAPASHVFGVGGLFGSPRTFGATARTWHNNYLGIQVGFSRDAMTSSSADGRVISTQIEPGVVYALFDRVSDYIWIRPYVGSVVSFRRQTLNIAAPVATEGTSDSGIGFRIFGGSELTFASVPRFGLSADVGYRRFSTPFLGFETDPLSVSIAGHWYVK